MSGEGEGVRLRVAIVTWRSRDLVERCLRSLFAHTRVEGMEVVVVDNASGDGTVELLRERFPQVRVVANDANLGFTRATNQAMAGAGTAPVLLLNPDTELHGTSSGPA
ncbi:MAG: glycosyltransferase [Planctomycetota bacterium]